MLYQGFLLHADTERWVRKGKFNESPWIQKEQNQPAYEADEKAKQPPSTRIEETDRRWTTERQHCVKKHPSQSVEGAFKGRL